MKTAFNDDKGRPLTYFWKELKRANVTSTKSRKRETRKRLNEHFPITFVDDEETPEPQTEPEKPKPDIDKVFNHVHQLLTNDEFLEDCFMLFGKQKDKIMIEIPVDA